MFIKNELCEDIMNIAQNTAFRVQNLEVCKEVWKITRITVWQVG